MGEKFRPWSHGITPLMPSRAPAWDLETLGTPWQWWDGIVAVGRELFASGPKLACMVGWMDGWMDGLSVVKFHWRFKSMLFLKCSGYSCSLPWISKLLHSPLAALGVRRASKTALVSKKVAEPRPGRGTGTVCRDEHIPKIGELTRLFKIHVILISWELYSNFIIHL